MTFDNDDKMMDFREEIPEGERFREVQIDEEILKRIAEGEQLQESGVRDLLKDMDLDENETDPDENAEDPEAFEEEDDEEEDQYDKVCMMCHRPESKAGKMIEMPGGMCVCVDCMQRSFTAFQTTDLDLDEMMKNLPPDVRMIDLSSLGTPVFPGMPAPQKGKKKKKKKEPAMTMKDVPAPHRIKAQLDEYVIGQERAKKIMSVGVYNHYKRVLGEKSPDVDIEKSNMLMIGPTGSGKTYMVQTLAKLLNVPLAITDATSLTEAGYIGDDIESVVSKLLAAADNDVERAERGIIFIDEIDKLAKKKNANQRDVSGESVQQGMLKLLEGSRIEVPVGASSKNAMVPMETVDTRNILFICGGAFPGLEDVIKERLNKKSSIGFQADLKDKYDADRNILMKANVEDLRTYGMIPEFLGRLPVLFSLEALTEDMLVDILKEPRNAILKQYKRLLEMDEVKLTFEDEALHAIAKKAMENDTGARALRAVIEEFMLDIMYEIPKDDNIGEVIITREYIENTGGPRIILRGQKLLEG